MRIPKPWFRKQTQTWYVEIDGRQHNLGKDEGKAFEQYRKLLGQSRSPTDDPKVRHLLDVYFDWCKKNLAESTVDRRKPILISFGKFLPAALKASELRPFHVQKWLDKRYPEGSSTYHHTLITTIKGAMEWAASQGYIEHSPIAKMKKPQPAVRQDFIPEALWPKVIAAATDTQFRDYLTFMLATGARPQEIAVVEARHVDGRRVVFPRDESKGRRRSRVIYLPDDAHEVVQRLVEKHPEGPIFRNRRGNPWTRNSVKCRFRHLRQALGMPKLCATVLRHSFAHHRLTQGQDSMVVAKLMGHVDGRMLAERYGHLDAASDFLEEEANRINSPLAPPKSEDSPGDQDNPERRSA